MLSEKRLAEIRSTTAADKWNDVSSNWDWQALRDLLAEVERLTPDAKLGAAVRAMAQVPDRISLEYIRRASCLDRDWWEVQLNRGWMGACDEIWDGATPDAALAAAAGLIDEPTP